MEGDFYMFTCIVSALTLSHAFTPTFLQDTEQIIKGPVIIICLI